MWDCATSGTSSAAHLSTGGDTDIDGKELAQDISNLPSHQMT